MIYSEQLDDLLIFEEEFNTPFKVTRLDDAFSFFDSLDSHRYLDTIQEHMQFVDRLSANGTIFTRTLTDTLVFHEDMVARAHLEILDDFLFLHDWLLGPEFKQLRDTLVFNDTMSGDAGVTARDRVLFVETMDYLIELGRTASDSLTFLDGMTIWKDDPFFSTYPIQEP